jgi:hypothetical protein
MTFGMTKALTRTLIALTGALFYSASSQAVPIVDTGASPFIGSADPGISVSGSSFFGSQFVAGRFTTTETFEITELSAFVRNYACCSVLTETFHLGIASGPASPSNSTFTMLNNVKTSFTAPSGGAGWANATINNFTLTAGTWWIVASVLPGDIDVGLGMPGGVPDPLDAYAYSNSTGTWNPLVGQLSIFAPMTFGFRVEGNAVSVPEPSSLLLMAIGLFLLLGAAANLQRRAS